MALSRRTNFWILPVEVFGSAPKTTVRGTLKCAMLARQKAMMSLRPSRRRARLQRRRTRRASRPISRRARATTAASITCGWR